MLFNLVDGGAAVGGPFFILYSSFADAMPTH
jgi:hypothetical protein